jgi:uncharacterized membrane protein YdjX (TVP38/TMEM64 family)
MNYGSQVLQNNVRGDLVKKPSKQFLLKLLPAIVAFVGIIIFLSYGQNITVDDIISYTPENKLMASIFILLMFFIKSLTVMFPVAIIYIVTGMIFPPFLAVLINIIGIGIGFSYSYWVGHTSTSNLKDQLMIKYPKLTQLDSLMKNNEWFITFIVRMVGIIPIDVVSIFMGSAGISFTKYLTASILGTLPILLTTTFIGSTITDPTSPEFILSLLLRVVISALSSLIYKKAINKTG